MCVLRNVTNPGSLTSRSQEHFQVPFMKATRIFYSTEGVRLVDEMDVPSYLNHVEKRLNVRFVFVTSPPLSHAHRSGSQ
jgi:hypothetical protein